MNAPSRVEPALNLASVQIYADELAGELERGGSGGEWDIKAQGHIDVAYS